VVIAIGDVGLAYQAFKIAISIDQNHAESYCNLGVRKREILACSRKRNPALCDLPMYCFCQVLEQRKQQFDAARSHFNTAQEVAPHLYEPLYNGGKSLNGSNAAHGATNLGS